MQPTLRIASEGTAKLPKRVSFSAAAIAAIPVPAVGYSVVYDTKVPALCVRVTSQGGRYFYTYRKINQKPVRMKLGKFGEISIDDARIQAADAAAKVAHRVNPLQERRQARSEMTLGELWAAYLVRHAKPHKKSWAQDEGNWTLHLAAHQKRPLGMVDTDFVSGQHNKLGLRAPYAANRVLALLSKMFSFAGSHLNWKESNPCKNVKRFSEVSRERFLEPSELKAFFAALEKMEDPLVRDFFWILLLTGARKSNVLAMRWEHIKTKEAAWDIPAAAAKGKKPIRVHLSTKCLEILKARRAAGEGAPWVFPTWSASGHLTQPKKAWKALLAASKLKDLRPHDLRRTLGSWQAALGTNMPTIGKSLGHSSAQATAIYSRVNLDPVRQSVDAATKAMLKHMPARNKKGK